MAIFFLTSLFLAGLAAPDGALAEMSAEKVAKKTRVSEVKGEENMLQIRGPDINSLKHDPYYVMSIYDPVMNLAAHFVIVEYDFIKAKGSGDSSIVQTADSLYKDFYIAVDAEGNEFNLKVIHRDFDGCGDNSFCDFEEYFRIDVPDEYFRAKTETGITLYARSRHEGALEIAIYPAYIQGLLSRMEKERRD